MNLFSKTDDFTNTHKFIIKTYHIINMINLLIKNTLFYKHDKFINENKLFYKKLINSPSKSFDVIKNDKFVE